LTGLGLNPSSPEDEQLLTAIRAATGSSDDSAAAVSGAPRCTCSSVRKGEDSAADEPAPLAGGDERHHEQRKQGGEPPRDGGATKGLDIFLGVDGTGSGRVRSALDGLGDPPAATAPILDEGGDGGGASVAAALSLSSNIAAELNEATGRVFARTAGAGAAGTGGSPPSRGGGTSRKNVTPTISQSGAGDPLTEG